MPLLTVKTMHGERSISFSPGKTLKYILDQADIGVRSGCSGNGACGLCRVRIEAAEINEATSNERVYLTDQQLVDGMRLACQVVPRGGLRVAVIDPLPESTWRSLPESNRLIPAPCGDQRMRESPLGIRNPKGAAVDVGTTHISLTMSDLSSAERLAGRYGLNPQVYFGSEIISRIQAALESPSRAEEMNECLLEEIGKALQDTAAGQGIDPRQVARVTIVGNTAMLALLSARNFEMLLHPENWMRYIDCVPQSRVPWAQRWGIHAQAEIELVPPLAGFVGSDLLAGALATRLTEGEAKKLLIDFGTNSELALWDGEVLWATSAAGGPAFEGSGISCGMPAEPGAIFQLNMDSDGRLHFSVIADGRARGICGSGMVDLIATLVRFGSLSTVGRFAPHLPKQEMVVAESDRPIILTKRDIDLFQRAKAAVAAGIRALMAEANVCCEDLQHVFVGGAFGHFLNVSNAQAVGLLPNVQADIVTLCGNTALAGCEQIMLFTTAHELIGRLVERAKIVNLAQYEEFETLFLDNLYLRPMENGS